MLDDELRDAMAGYYRVGSVTSLHEMTQAVRFVQSRLWVDRLEATVEAHTMVAAQVREATGIPGTSVHTTWLCRDKPSMKEALRRAGVPTAASAAVDHAHEAWDFAEPRWATRSSSSPVTVPAPRTPCGSTATPSWPTR